MVQTISTKRKGHYMRTSMFSVLCLVSSLFCYDAPLSAHQASMKGRHEKTALQQKSKGKSEHLHGCSGRAILFLPNTVDGASILITPTESDGTSKAIVTQSQLEYVVPLLTTDPSSSIPFHPQNQGSSDSHFTISESGTYLADFFVKAWATFAPFQYHGQLTMCVEVISRKATVQYGMTKLASLSERAGVYDTLVSGTGQTLINLRKGDRVRLVILNLPVAPLRPVDKNVAPQQQVIGITQANFYFDPIGLDADNYSGDEVSYLSLHKVS